MSFMRIINMLPRRNGGAIAETAAAMVLLLPLIVSIVYAVVEVSTYFAILNYMSLSAHQASRNLVVAYWKNPQIVYDRALQDSAVFDNIRYPGMVNESAQFDDPIWNLTSDPKTVEVTVRYAGGQYSLQPFPAPDPLRLGPITITSTASYAID